jgi:hypothetical protein
VAGVLRSERPETYEETNKNSSMKMLNAMDAKENMI